MSGSSREATDTAFLTGMRGVAALMVFLFHSGGLGLRSLGGIADNVVDNSRYGIAIFFVISAYCLCIVTERAWAGAAIDWRAFYIRRVFRILPLYFTVIAANLVVMICRGTVPADLGWSLLAHLTFLNIFDVAYNNDLLGVEWTITVEFAFYLLFPIVLVVARKAPLALLPVTALLANNEVRTAIANALGPDYAVLHNHTLVWYFFAFVLGIGTYSITRRFRFERQPSELTALSFGLVLVWTMIHPIVVGTEVQVAVAAAGLIVACCNPETLLSRVLRTPLFNFLGTISFSIYLLHFTVLSFLPRTDPGGAVALAVTLGLAALTCKYIETPFREWGRALAVRTATAGRPAKAIG